MRRSVSLTALLLLAACATSRPTAEGSTAGPASEAARPRPAFATEGWQKPRESKPGCVGEALDPPADYRGKEVVVRIAVAPSGAVDGFDDATDPPDRSGELTEALGKAIEACAFVPGRDPDGRAATTWLVLRMRAAAKPKPAPDLDD